jgi:hypothetical protein
MAKFEIGEYAFVLVKADSHDVDLHCEVVGIEKDSPLEETLYTIKILNYKNYGLTHPLISEVPESFMIKKPYPNKIMPIRIIYNDPATIVFWDDDTKTVVKRAKGEKFNKYNAFCAALAKKIYENNSQVRKIVESGEEQIKKDIQKKGKRQSCRNK